MCSGTSLPAHRASSSLLRVLQIGEKADSAEKAGRIPVVIGYLRSLVAL